VKSDSQRHCGIWAALVVLGAVGCAQFQQGPFDVPEEGVSHVEVDGFRIRYETVGAAGSPVVLLHGYGASLSDWERVAPELCARHRCLLLDLPGFGWSDKYEGDYSPRRLARFVAALMDHFGFAAAHVVAHSWGSSVALALALEAPARVTSLTLTGAWVYYAQLNSFLLWARVPALGEALYTLFFDEQPEIRYRMVFYDPEPFVEDAKIARIKRVLQLPGFKRAALQAARDQDLETLEPHYHTVTQPALLVWGAEDRVARPFFGERLVTDLPNAALKVIPHSGHAPQLETPAAWLGHVAPFLAREDRRRAAAEGAP
jgi:pimeloyl-ACP methyl ester carboxylesterase